MLLSVYHLPAPQLIESPGDRDQTMAMLVTILHEGSAEYELLTKSQNVLFRRLLLEIRVGHVRFDVEEDRTSAKESLKTLQSFRDSSMEECVLVIIDLV